MKYAVSVAGKIVEVEIIHEKGQMYALVGGQKIPVELVQHERGRHTLLFGSRSISLWLSGHGTGYVVGWRGRSLNVEVEPAHARALRERFRRGKDAQTVSVEEVRAFMPGLVVNVEVEPGQRVRPGDGLVVISAMKMENEIRASCEGIVEKVSVQAGQEVKKGQLLCVIRYEQERL
jgi:biotin carboxyl carrier protein